MGISSIHLLSRQLTASLEEEDVTDLLCDLSRRFKCLSSSLSNGAHFIIPRALEENQSPPVEDFLVKKVGGAKAEGGARWEVARLCGQVHVHMQVTLLRCANSHHGFCPGRDEQAPCFPSCFSASENTQDCMCIYVHLCVFMYVCMCMHVREHVCVHVIVYVCIRIYVHVYICVLCICVCMGMHCMHLYVCVRACVFLVCAHVRVCVYTNGGEDKLCPKGHSVPLSGSLLLLKKSKIILR